MPRSSFVPARAVIDSNCLIHLDHLDLTLDMRLVQSLSLRYETVYIPEYVLKEIGRKQRYRYRIRHLLRQYPFLQKCTIGDSISAQMLYKKELNPVAPIDRGEAEAIIEARERDGADVLTDDRKGRITAKKHNLNVRGIWAC